MTYFAFSLVGDLFAKSSSFKRTVISVKQAKELLVVNDVVYHIFPGNPNLSSDKGQLHKLDALLIKFGVDAVVYPSKLVWENGHLKYTPNLQLEVNDRLVVCTIQGLPDANRKYTEAEVKGAEYYFTLYEVPSKG